MSDRDLEGKVYQIGRHLVLLPLDHRLDEYQRSWPKYDAALGRVAIEVHKKYPSASAIDIGANVGDSVALINGEVDIPVLAIEGNELFIPYLYRNAVRIGGHIEVFEGYVGPHNLTFSESLIEAHGGTASLKPANEAGGCALVKLEALSEIVAGRAQFADARLLKIDTDGFDFEIIISSVCFLEKNSPVVFFEYCTGFSPQDERLSLKAIGELMRIGYDRFIVWDNFGHFMISVEAYNTFVELNSFLRSNRENGTAINYLDVCAFHSGDRDVFESIRSFECSD